MAVYRLGARWIQELGHVREGGRIVRANSVNAGHLLTSGVSARYEARVNQRNLNHMLPSGQRSSNDRPGGR
jgi:hypothetical protein